MNTDDKKTKTADEYLREVVAAHTFKRNDQELTDLRQRGKDVRAVLERAYSDKAVLRYAGSYKKRTMIRDSYDLDVLCYFRRDENVAGETLKAIFEHVRDTLAKEYVVTPKRSALRLEKQGSDETANYTHVDVVPGRFIDDDENDVFVYQNVPDAERLQTNPEIHVNHLRHSGLRKVVKLAKIWRQHTKLDIKTFVLELLIVKILDGKDDEDDELDELFHDFLVEVRDRLNEYPIVDPANSGNDLNEIFTEDVKSALKDEASRALDVIEESGFEGIFGEAEALENAVQKHAAHVDGWRVLLLGDSQHCVPPTWKRSLTPLGRVTIQCTEMTRSGKQRSLNSNGAPIPIFPNNAQANPWLRYRANVTVPEPYEVYWQVVNTGPSVPPDGRRGDTFIPSTMRDQKPSPDKHVHEEKTAYVGKHWIQCFIVKGGLLVAQSERFYLRLIAQPPRFKFVKKR